MNLDQTMLFRQLNQAIITLLGENEYGRYQTIGYQRQKKSEQDAKGTKRLVQVYYNAGEFPKGAGRGTAATRHDMTFRIEFTVSALAKVDLTIINNPEATPNQLQAALEKTLEAAKLADDSFNELVNIIYQILMNPVNYDFGFDKGLFSSRWVNQVQKDDPIERGQLVVLVGSMLLTVITEEQISGETPKTTPGVQDTNIELSGDDVTKTGIKTE